MKNKYCIEGTTAIIELTQGQKAIIDAKDLSLVSMHRWCALKKRRTCYAVTHIRVDGKWRKLRMHRIINNTPDDLHTDHVDGDGLNNRRKNLRTATTAQNAWNRGIQETNSSGFKGVSFRKGEGKWEARIQHHGKRKYLGSFATAERAADAYYAAAMLLRGAAWNRRVA